MSVPGNQNAKGNKGGGRKSAYEELGNANFLWDVFNKEYTPEELELMLASEQNSIRKQWIRKMLKGDTAIIKQAIDKFWANKQHNVIEGGDLQFTLNVIPYEDDTSELEDNEEAESGSEVS